jgi:hypothetical protein
LMAAAFMSGSVYATDVARVAEASMLVRGTVDVLPDGSVANYTLYKAEKLPAPVVDLIKRSVTTWKFELKEARTTPLQEEMSLRIVATDAGDRHVTLHLAGADFSDEDAPEDATIRWAHRVSPSYPKFSLDNHMSGTVYVFARVGRDGKVIDVAVEQVNLRRYVSDPTMMARFRQDLANAAVLVAKHWTFKAPTSGDQVNAPFWDAQIPVNFDVDALSSSAASYGSWEIYVRGPQERIEWLQDSPFVSETPDAIPDGSIHPLGNGPRLMTPLATN